MKTALVLTFLSGFAFCEPAPKVKAKRADGKTGSKILKLHALSLDLTKQRIVADGNICLDEGLIEYLAVVPGGKEHESLLRLFCRPADFDKALRVLGLRPGRGVDFQGQQKTPTGDSVELFVSWELKGKTVQRRAEELVWNVQAKRSMRPAHWVYVGSKFEKDSVSGKKHFMASVERNLVATFHDPYVLIDHQLETGADDTVYEVNHKLVPPRGTPVKLIVLKGAAGKFE